MNMNMKWFNKTDIFKISGGIRQSKAKGYLLWCLCYMCGCNKREFSNYMDFFFKESMETRKTFRWILFVLGAIPFFVIWRKMRGKPWLEFEYLPNTLTRLLFLEHGTWNIESEKNISFNQSIILSLYFWKATSIPI